MRLITLFTSTMGFIGGISIGIVCVNIVHQLFDSSLKEKREENKRLEERNDSLDNRIGRQEEEIASYEQMILTNRKEIEKGFQEKKKLEIRNKNLLRMIFANKKKLKEKRKQNENLLRMILANKKKDNL